MVTILPLEEVLGVRDLLRSVKLPLSLKKGGATRVLKLVGPRVEYAQRLMTMINEKFY